MREPGVETDHHLGARQHSGDVGQAAARHHGRALHARRAGACALALLVRAPEQQAGPAPPGKCRGHGGPALVGPQLAGPAGVGQQHGIRRGNLRRERGRHAAGRQTEARRLAVDRVAQRRSAQSAVACHGVQAPVEADRAAVRACRQGLARRAAIGPGNRRLRPARDQCALDEPLAVEHEVVVGLTQAGTRLRDLAPGGRPPQRPAPAPQRHGDHLRHRRMQPRNGGKRLLHRPVDARLRPHPRQIGHQRQRMDDVAQRRGLDDQQVHGGACYRPGRAA